MAPAKDLLKHTHQTSVFTFAKEFIELYSAVTVFCAIYLFNWSQQILESDAVTQLYKTVYCTFIVTGHYPVNDCVI